RFGIQNPISGAELQCLRTTVPSHRVWRQLFRISCDIRFLRLNFVGLIELPCPRIYCLPLDETDAALPWTRALRSRSCDGHSQRIITGAANPTATDCDCGAITDNHAGESVTSIHGCRNSIVRISQSRDEGPALGNLGDQL